MSSIQVARRKAIRQRLFNPESTAKLSFEAWLSNRRRRGGRDETMLAAGKSAVVLLRKVRENRMYLPLRATAAALLGAALLFAAAGAQTLQPGTHSAAPVTSPGTSLPANLERLPSRAPDIIYENGLLTISADNSTLSDILRGIGDQTGAEVDIPPQAEERVVMRLGPGPACEVVHSLLRGSRFNYVIVGANGDPNRLTKILLFPMLAAESASAPSVNTAGAAKQRDESLDVAEDWQTVANPDEPVQPVRSFQRMLQQRGEARMEDFQRKQQPK
jgi:hypothetical protein